MKNKQFIFLRNDDVRNSLDIELIDLTKTCIDLNIPISHAVEPANVTEEVVKWLLEEKRKYPELIEIIQHGYDHNKENPSVKMEFGGMRDYSDQLVSIKAGKELMDSYFDGHWSPVFTFPYGTYNHDTLKAVDAAGYKAISGKISYSTKNILKNTAGKFLGKNFLLNKKISYHGSKRRDFSFSELSVSANLIKKYIDDKKAEHYDLNEILDQVVISSKYSNVTGILFHHRFHTYQMEMIKKLLTTLKEHYSYSTIMGLLR